MSPDRGGRQWGWAGHATGDVPFLQMVCHKICYMTLHNAAECETLYDVLSVKEDASDEEIRLGYRHALLSYHPDKLQASTILSNLAAESKDQFMKVQKAWEILGNPRSKALYDNELRASRSDVIVSDEICIEHMIAEDNRGYVELYHQCRCGDYFSVSCSELEEMGFKLVRDGYEILVRIPDEKPGSVILPCASCSLRIRLLINENSKVEFGDPS